MQKIIFVTLLIAFKAYAFESALKGVTFKFGGITPSLEVKAENKETAAKALEYKPSTQAKTFLGIDYKNYGLSLSAFNPRTSDFRQKYGEGRASIFNFAFHMTNFTLKRFISSTKAIT